MKEGAWSAAFRPEGREALKNPWRGWTELTQFALCDDADADAAYLPTEHGLSLLEVNVSAYRDRPLGDRGLVALDRLLSRFRAAGQTLALRPLYDWSGDCWRYEPDEIQLVKTHIGQLRPLLKEYADILFVVQGVLLGNWAEMHGSAHLTGANIRALLTALWEASDERTWLAVRTPAHWRAATRCEAFDEGHPLAGRLSLYNDAMLSSPDDFGTYAPPDATPATPLSKRPPKAELAFQSALCLHAPNGGETAAPYQDNEGMAFCAAMDALRPTYLSAHHHPDVLAGWKKTPFAGRGAWRGASCYEAIGARLGYRLVLDSVKCKHGTLSLALTNVGCAGLYRRESVELRLLGAGETSAAPIVLPIETNTKAWGQRIALEAAFPPLPQGVYRVYLRIGNIRLANRDAYDEDVGANLLGTWRAG